MEDRRAAVGCARRQLARADRCRPRGMVPTLRAGDTILVDQDAYRRAKPRIGDIVAFHPPAGAVRERRCGRRPPAGQACATATRRNSARNFIKRIVGRPGDRVSIRHGHVIRDGERARRTSSRPARPVKTATSRARSPSPPTATTCWATTAARPTTAATGDPWPRSPSSAASSASAHESIPAATAPPGPSRREPRSSQMRSTSPAPGSALSTRRRPRARARSRYFDCPHWARAARQLCQDWRAAS